MGYKDFQHIYNQTWSGHCAWCGAELAAVMKHPENSEGDHWKPRSRGGTESTLPCCPRCNSIRGNKSPLQFLRYCRDNRPEVWEAISDWHIAGKNELSRMVQKVRDEEDSPW